MDLALVKVLKECPEDLDAWEKIFTTEIPVLKKGFVRLDGILADDLCVANSARVSFGRHKTKLDDPDVKLIGYLIRNKHSTPLEHNLFRMHVKAPLVVIREWQRHRIGVSYNEFSGRYAKFNPEFYIPEIEDVRVQTGKPGQYTFNQAPKGLAEAWLEQYQEWIDRGAELYEKAVAPPIEGGYGIAKEQARYTLAVTVFSEMYFSVNARALMHFISLRNSPQAMYEIRVYAQALEDLLQDIMPNTYRYFVENGRLSP